MQTILGRAGEDTPFLAACTRSMRSSSSGLRATYAALQTGGDALQPDARTKRWGYETRATALRLVVSSEHDEPVVMYLRKQGPGTVTAADIRPPAGVEVHNPELHLATLNAKGKLDMELTVPSGRSYVSEAQNKQPAGTSAASRSTRSSRRCTRCSGMVRWPRVFRPMGHKRASKLPNRAGLVVASPTSDGR